MRIGLCGYGSMGRHHSQLFRKHIPVVELAGVADASAERRELAAQDHPGVQLWDSGQEMLANANLDVVFVCVPTYLHAELSVQALQAGCHVFCEKPMALQPEECQTMITAANESQRSLMIGQVLRFWPEYIYLKELCDSRRYGPLQSLSMTRVGGVSTGWQGWYLDERRGGMQIFDRHIHDSDAVLWILGQPRAVQSYGFSLDPHTAGGINHSFTHYDFGPELLVSAEGSADMPAGFPFTAAYRATFARACLEFNSRQQPTLTLYADGQASHPELPNFLEDVSSGLNISSAGPYFNEQAYFFACVRAGQKPATVTPESAMQTIKLVRAEIASCRSAKPVTIQ